MGYNRYAMNTPDLVVIGAGISGLAYAWRAARAGMGVLVLERRPRIGGCIYSYRFDDGFWYELGAHTVYNSYGGLLDIVEETGLAGRLVRRGPARARFGLLRDGEIDWLTPPKILGRLNWLEIALCGPFGLLRSKRNRTLSQYYSGLVGRRNFARLLSPFLAAVPSQSADLFPAEGPGSLFKKRIRRKDYPRSFGFPGGLQTVCDAIAAHPNITVRTACAAVALAPSPDGFEIRLEQGDTVRARHAAVAVPHRDAASLLRDAYPALAHAVGRIDSAAVESLGTRLPRSRCPLPECAFVVPADGDYFSAVSRDPFPDPDWRAFAFHFRPGTERGRKVDRMRDLLHASPEDLDILAGQDLVLPSPRADHAETVAQIEKNLLGTRLALLGNYFTGLAIEDCIERASVAWRRRMAP